MEYSYSLKVLDSMVYPMTFCFTITLNRTSLWKLVCLIHLVIMCCFHFFYFSVVPLTGLTFFFVLFSIHFIWYLVIHFRNINLYFLNICDLSCSFISIINNFSFYSILCTYCMSCCSFHNSIDILQFTITIIVLEYFTVKWSYLPSLVFDLIKNVRIKCYLIHENNTS